MRSGWLESSMFVVDSGHVAFVVDSAAIVPEVPSRGAVLAKHYGVILLRTRIGGKRPTRAWGAKVERAWASCDRSLRASIGTREYSWTSAEIGGVVQLGEDSRQSAAPHSLCTCSWSTAMRAD